MERLRQRAYIAAVAPHGGRVVPEIGRADVREVFLRSYRLMYKIIGNRIKVVTILEGHQRFPADLDPDA
jgi:toxin ParE1/3/4